MPRADRHNEMEFNLILQGSLTYMLGGDLVTLRAGELAGFWAAIPHQIIAPRDPDSPAEYFVLTTPLAWFLQLQLPVNFVQPMLKGKVAIADISNRIPLDQDLFTRWAKELEGPSPNLRRASLLEIEARLLRMGSGFQGGKNKGKAPTTQQRFSGPGKLGKAEQMARLIALRYQTPLTVEEISQAVDLHPGYAMTLFRKTFGMSLVTSINQHRLTHAKRLLSTTNKPVLAIAFDSGFGSLSRFNDAFRKENGFTPRQYRSLHLPISSERPHRTKGAKQP